MFAPGGPCLVVFSFLFRYLSKIDSGIDLCLFGI